MEVEYFLFSSYIFSEEKTVLEIEIEALRSQLKKATEDHEQEKARLGGIIKTLEQVSSILLY